MPPDVEPDILEKKVSEVRNVAVSYANILDDGEILSGTPTIVEVTTPDLTLTDKIISTVKLTINGKSVPIAEAVQFKVAVGLANTNYDIRITISTDATPAQTLITTIRLRVKAD